MMYCCVYLVCFRKCFLISLKDCLKGSYKGNIKGKDNYIHSQANLPFLQLYSSMFHDFLQTITVIFEKKTTQIVCPVCLNSSYHIVTNKID